MTKRHLRTDPIVRRPAIPTPPGGTHGGAGGGAGGDPSGRSSAARLAVVRMALLAGVLAFGAAVWWARRGQGAPDPSAAPPALRTFGAAIWVAALAGVVGFWLLIPRARDARRRTAYTIFAWAAAEMPAVFGAAFYYLTGDTRWFAAGLTLLVGSMVVVSGKR